MKKQTMKKPTYIKAAKLAVARINETTGSDIVSLLSKILTWYESVDIETNPDIMPRQLYRNIIQMTLGSATYTDDKAMKLLKAFLRWYESVDIETNPDTMPHQLYRNIMQMTLGSAATSNK